MPMESMIRLAAGYDGIDINDPFGGNDGLNQAKLVVGGPVQVYSPGYRNIYDVVLTTAGRLYTWDNGPNGNWGGHPDNEGSPSVTNDWVPGEPGSNGPGPNDNKVNNKDGLHFVTGQGYYGGHPNPIRANPNGAGLFTHDHSNGSGGNKGVFRTAYDPNDPQVSLPYDWPPVDPSLANPAEADFQNPGADDQSLWTVKASTNGMCEYTASNFGGALKGDLLATSWNENLYRVDLNSVGSINSESDVSSLGQNFGTNPLDVTSQGDSVVFPGTIWVAAYGSDKIAILEPQDFLPCSGVDSLFDEDSDGFTNSDELDNLSDPCNGSNLPADFDGTLIGGFKVSNLNDPDDDDDGISDTTDLFVWDANNGSDLMPPFDYSLLNGDPGTGFFGLGFTGLMSNGITDYLDLIQDEENSTTEIIAGGAVGLLTYNDLPAGHPFGTQNDLRNGFQFGVAIDSNTAELKLDVKLLGPVFQNNPQGDQFHGFYIGKGDQDNFLMMAIDANNGTPLLKFTEELDNVDSVWTVNDPNIAAAAEISLIMIINPATGEIQAQVDAGSGIVDVGPVITLRGALRDILRGGEPLAIGVAAGRSSSTATFNATWDYIKLEYVAGPPVPTGPSGTWSYLQTGNSCNALGTLGSCAEGRHEASYVQVSDKFVLLGGREVGSRVNIYDPSTGIWTAGSAPDFVMHHFQALEYEGLIYIISAFEGDFPDETPVPSIWMYDITSDEWIEGPPMPAGRARGSAGVVEHNGKFYVIGGIINGHVDGWVQWTDVFDPATNSWSALADAPHQRDHFHAALHNGKIYCAAGRRTGKNGLLKDTESDVDVYDIATNSWSTLASPIPTERAAAAVAVLGDDILVIGGEKEWGSAKDETEALNTTTGTWRSLSNLNKGRHGTAAIVNNGGVYVAAGSPVAGGGKTSSHEVFFFGAPTPPVLTPINPGSISASSSNITFPITNAGDSTTKTLTIFNTGGDQGIILKDVQFNNGLGLSVDPEYDLPYHLSPGQSFDFTITYKPNVTGSPNDLLTINHSGSNPNTQILIGNPPAADCHGDIGGTAAVDLCNVCAGGNTGITPNSTCTDCNGDVNGFAFIDNCNVCAGGTTGITPDASCADCAGVPNGGAVIDSCGDCVLGSTGIAFNSGCNIDCAGVPNGTAAIDACGDCAGGTTGITPDLSCTDCAGVVNGTASFDDCGVCSGGTTGLVANASCADCAGVANGSAAIDTCGVCAGGTTGVVPNMSCVGCVANEVVSFSLMQADQGDSVIRQLVNGDIIYKSLVGAFSIRADICSGGTVGSVVFNLSGNNIRTENVAPYAINGDKSGNYNSWNPTNGTYTATPYSSGGGGGTAGVAEVITITIANNPPAIDCHGDIGGTAAVDLCNVCAGGNTGITPNSTCTDCNGDVNGSAYMDNCNICAGGNTGVTPDASCTDCDGVLNGSAFMDNCNVCAGGTTGITPDASCADCAGVPNGGAVIDSCGDCVLGSTGIAFNSGCNIDCAGVPNGTAAIDACGDCAGGTTGITPDLSCTDCAGVVNGTASFDDCGVCSGGTTGLVANASCADCAGVANGNAAIDTCGVCAGGTTGVVPNMSCVGCVADEVVSFSLMQAASGDSVIRQLVNGDIIYKSLVGAFSIRADICSGGTVGSVVFNLSGNNIRTENVAPYAINGDKSGNYNSWNPANGTYVLTATPYSSGGGGGTAGVAEVITITIANNPPAIDCHGDIGGTAAVDLCNVCAGGNTGITPNSTCTDCNGDVNGSAFIDNCNVCAGGNTGVTPDASCTDCDGVLNGSASFDACGVCAGGTTGITPDASCADCAGVPNGGAVIDSCGDCVLGSTGIAFNSGCNIDCAGVPNGTAAIDACGDCAGGNTGITPDLSCTDCAGVVNGTASFDDCGVCSGGTTGLVANASCADCAGVANGNGSYRYLWRLCRGNHRSGT